MTSMPSREEPATVGTDPGSPIPPAQHLRAALGLACLLPLAALAQSSSASFEVPRQSIDGGAARSTSASYALDGSIGQPDAGATSTSATYTLSGGFHRAAAAPQPDALFANGFESP
jgi:hypothetical protein